MENKDELLLTQIVLMFQTAALQQMGKLKNPMTDAIERDLQQAQMSIDILDMFKRKMKGNLSPAEERLMTDILRELRLNFVDEAAKDRAKEPPAAATPAAGAPPAEAGHESGGPS